MRRRMSEAEVSRIVSQIDGTTRDLFSLTNVDDAPKARTFRKREKEDPRITRAKSRLRMAAWRKKNAEAKRPNSHEISMAMLKALATSMPGDLTRNDYNLVGRAFADLQRRGFDIREAKAYLQRMRDQIIPPADRAGEPSADTMF